MSEGNNVNECLKLHWNASSNCYLTALWKLYTLKNNKVEIRSLYPLSENNQQNGASISFYVAFWTGKISWFFKEILDW